MALEALRHTGQRGVLYAGWGGLHKEDLPDTVFMVGSTPHSWLFPRMAAVVHHGGAGTTAAGLAAGVPAVVTPFFADQPFWAQRVYDLGAGPKACSAPQAHGGKPGGVDRGGGLGRCNAPAGRCPRRTHSGRRRCSGAAVALIEQTVK